MNIFYLILVFLFTTHSTLALGKISGNGLLCENKDIGRVVGYWFEAGAVKRFDIIGIKVKMKMYENYKLYGPNKLFWLNKNGSHIIFNRKDLLVTGYKSCKHVTSKKLLLDKLKEIALVESEKNIF